MITKKTDVEFRSGLTAQDMMVSGETEWQMGMEDWYTLKVMSMKASGLKIKRMGMVFIHISMEAGTKANGFKINNTASESNNGQTVPNTKETMSKA